METVMGKECTINDLTCDIERLRNLSQEESDWIQLTYGDQSADPSISETETTVEEWELELEGVVTRGTPE